MSRGNYEASETPSWRHALAERLLGARASARRHQAELGEVVAVYHDRPGVGTIAGGLITWLLMTALTFINPGETLVLAIAPSVGLFICMCILYVMLAGERLVVCERGVLLGSVAPFMRPYVIRYEQMVPGSVVPISGKITRFGKQTGIRAMNSVRISWWARRGVSLGGPSLGVALGRFPAQPAETYGPGFPWLIGTRAPAEQATADIARAAGAAGFHELARATAAAPPRVLSGNSEDNPRQLPGIVLPGSR